MNFDKIFEIFGKKIFYAIALSYWFIFLYGSVINFNLDSILNDSLKYSLVFFGVLSTVFVVLDILGVFGNWLHLIFSNFIANKKRKDNYLKAIETIRGYSDIDGLGILLTLCYFPSRGDHHNKMVDEEHSRSQVTSGIVNTYSEITVDPTSLYGGKLISGIKSDYYGGNIVSFKINKAFFDFLMNDYFVKNSHQKVNLLSDLDFLTKSSTPYSSRSRGGW